jgi:hypothetical protein
MLSLPFFEQLLFLLLDILITRTKFRKEGDRAYSFLLNIVFLAGITIGKNAGAD